MAKTPRYYVRPDGLHETIRTINGKRVPFRGRTDAEVEQKMIAYKGMLEKGRPFKDIAEEWKESHWETIAHNTARGYEAALNRIIAEFDDKSIKEIQPKSIDRFLKSLAADHFSQKTISCHKTLCNMILNYAVVEGLIESNPCTSVQTPTGKAKVPRELPSDEDIEKVKKSIDLPFGLLHFFVLYSGLRRGEALALTYGDIDRKNKLIHVTKSLYYKNAKPEIKSPKTAAGHRSVILLDILAVKIPKGKDAAYVFFPGPPEYKTTLERHLRKYREKSGVTCTLHQLRHAYATILYEANIDEKSAQELLGHASIAMTRDLYTHISKKKSTQTADKLNQFVNSGHSLNTVLPSDPQNT